MAVLKHTHKENNTKTGMVNRLPFDITGDGILSAKDTTAINQLLQYRDAKVKSVPFPGDLQFDFRRIDLDGDGRFITLTQYLAIMKLFLED